jgi:type II secretory pathway pseudopilin PulG
MPTVFYFRFAAFVFVAILCGAIVYAWQADRRDRAQLAAELASTKQLLVAADARQHDRDAQLAQTLAAFAEQKRSIVTPAQIVRELQKNIPLPAPLNLQPDLPSSESPQTNSGNAPTGEAVQTPQPSPATTIVDQHAPGSAIIPRADLKPLYDFTLDRQACQAKLSAAQSDLVDEKSKTAALTKERDDAVRIAKGGSAWRRVTRAAKWFLLGAAAGAVVARAR